MTTPVAGAVTAVAKGNRVPKGTLAKRRREAKAPATPPPPDTPKVTPAVTQSNSKPLALPQVTVPQPVSSGAGFILALMVWTWVVIPFLNGGTAGVRAQLKAKFTNKAPDGSWLP